MWGLPFDTHKYFVEYLGGVHAHTMIISRFVNFLQSALKSKKLAVQFMLRRSLANVNSITGKNASHIQQLTGFRYDILNISKKWLKNNLKFCELEEKEKWRVRLVKEITDIKQNILTLQEPEKESQFLTSEQFDDILNFVCTN